MEYNDALISSPEQFSLLAKEYSQRLKQNKILTSQLVQNLALLKWIFAYIERNVGIWKIKDEFKAFGQTTSSWLNCFLQDFEIDENSVVLNKPRRIGNFRSCVRLAIVNQTQAASAALQLQNSIANFEDFVKICLETIKELAKYI